MMSSSRILNDSEPIANTEIIDLRIAAGSIAVVGQEHITPLTLEGISQHR
ncbi:MAG: hypothetical protein M3O02_11725 [Acidobacteriota bacterium]|nr:hypothetical protein [Acidobacteriota bacterium]